MDSRKLTIPSSSTSPADQKSPEPDQGVSSHSSSHAHSSDDDNQSTPLNSSFPTKAVKLNLSNSDDKIIHLTNEIENVIHPGHLGWYQFLILSCVMLMKISQGLNGSLPVFTNADVEHRCETVFDQHCNLTSEQQKLVVDNYFNSEKDEKCGNLNFDACHVQGWCRAVTW